MTSRPDRAWLIANPASGSVSPEAAQAVVAAVGASGLALAGETHFPETPLPSPADLDRAGATLLIVFAGDGTVNAAARAFEGWSGRLLVLPGGTMNLLARRLHGNLGAADIVAAARDAPAIRLPTAEAAGHTAYVGIIAGPLAAWHAAREAVRFGELGALLAAARQALARSLARGVRVQGAATARRHHKAVVVEPAAGGLEIAAVGADSLAAIVRIGANWLTGDWRAAPDVGASCAREVVLGGPRRLLALFDGEPRELATPVRVAHGESRVRFVTTLAPASPEREER
jgi:diacylglycerol kinase family enzyme